MLKVTTTVSQNLHMGGHLELETQIEGAGTNGERLTVRDIEPIQNFISKSIFEAVMERHVHVLKNSLRDAMTQKGWQGESDD